MTTNQLRCDERVAVGNWGRFAQCSRAGVLAHGSKYYCRQHHPDAVAARQAASSAAYLEKVAKSPEAQAAKLSEELKEARRLLKWAEPLFEAQDGVSIEDEAEVDAYRRFMGTTPPKEAA